MSSFSESGCQISLKILVFFTPFFYLIYYFFFANNKEHCCSQEAFLTSLKFLTDSINQVFRQCLIRCFVLLQLAKQETILGGLPGPRRIREPRRTAVPWGLRSRVLWWWGEFPGCFWSVILCGPYLVWFRVLPSGRCID